MEKRRILIVEDDLAIRSNVAELLDEEGFEVLMADNGADGVALALARDPHLIVCDIMLPRVDGYAVLRAMRELSATARIPFIFLSAKAERADIRAGMNLGADDYITKPFTLGELLEAIQSRMKRTEELSHGGLERAVTRHGDSRPRAPGIAGDDQSAEPPAFVVRDPEMRKLYDQLARAAASPITLLILGETGAGKEVLARAAHRLSSRSTGPFVAINCAALSETLLESELFGHERGAFTGALQARPGLFEVASGGTLFLDEVGDLPPATQVKLLRALEERKVLRVGARAPTDVDVRFVSATNVDLEAKVNAGAFREDLYYRLNGISFTLPPLRERKSELRPLCQLFLKNARSTSADRRELELSEEAFALLEQYSWPGNVRELKNVLERGAILAEAVILPEHLPEKLRKSSWPPPPSQPREKPLDAQAERALILDALDRCGGNQTRAAEALGVSRRTLVYRLTELDLPRPRKRFS